MLYAHNINNFTINAVRTFVNLENFIPYNFSVNVMWLLLQISESLLITSKLWQNIYTDNFLGKSIRLRNNKGSE